MIGYVTFGTNDIQRAAAFYDQVLGVIGAKRVMNSDSFIAWGTDGSPMLAVINPNDKKAATVGNGVMVALSVPNEDQIKSIHAKALSLGGKDEGAPGPRGSGFYAAYFRDLDGNKLNAFKMG